MALIAALGATAALASGAPRLERSDSTFDGNTLITGANIISRAELTDEQKAAFEDRRTRIGDLAELDDEQKAALEEKRAELESKMADMKAKADAQTEKWNALTDAQKEEVYALMEKSVETQIQTVNKYLELGLISEEDAANMKDALSNSVDKMRESGRAPIFGGLVTHELQEAPGQAAGRVFSGKFGIELPAEPEI